MRGDEGVLKATMQVDSVGVKEQPKLKKVRNIIIIFITRTIQTDYLKLSLLCKRTTQTDDDWF